MFWLNCSLKVVSIWHRQFGGPFLWTWCYFLEPLSPNLVKGLLHKTLRLKVWQLHILNTYLRIRSDKYNYQTESLEAAQEICGCRTTNIYFIYGLWVLINLVLLIKFILSLELFFHNTGYYAMELVESGKEHAFVYAIINDLNKLPISNALSCLVVKQSYKISTFIALILQLKKLRHKELWYHTRSHSQDRVCLAADPESLTLWDTLYLLYYTASS